MSIEVNNVWLYRIIPLENLENNLKNGLFSKRFAPPGNSYISLGNQDIISRRETTPVKCFPGTVVNDYIPFYFSLKTPMLYNIIKGHGVQQVDQDNVIYLCFKLIELVRSGCMWCYTDGNAAVRISACYKDISDLSKLDWHSIQTDDFRVNNTDNDPDRIRKKHAEFLVKDFLASSYINSIVVFSNEAQKKVEQILEECNKPLKVFVNPNNKFYF
jgi:hypothetical protein